MGTCGEEIPIRKRNNIENNDKNKECVDLMNEIEILKNDIENLENEMTFLKDIPDNIKFKKVINKIDNKRYTFDNNLNNENNNYDINFNNSFAINQSNQFMFNNNNQFNKFIIELFNTFVNNNNNIIPNNIGFSQINPNCNFNFNNNILNNNNSLQNIFKFELTGGAKIEIPINDATTIGDVISLLHNRLKISNNKKIFLLYGGNSKSFETSDQTLFKTLSLCPNNKIVVMEGNKI